MSGAPVENDDFRRSWRGRRQSWFGAKALVKRFFGFSIPHAMLRLLVARVPRLRSGRLPAPRALREVRGRVGGASFVMLRPDRCEIAKELYWGGGVRPRPEDQNALEIVTRSARRADVFLDVGAYTGVFTLAAAVANPGLAAHAFEIVPAVADLLAANVSRNGLDARVIVHREGIGAPDASMIVPVGDVGSALPSFYSSNLRFAEGVRVPFVSLDSLADLVEPGRSVVMKIDVEGTETAIFRNGMTFVDVHRPTMLCEVLAGVGDGDLLTELLEPLGYRFFSVRERDVLERPAIVPDARYRDWLFAPDDREDGAEATS